MCVGARGDDVKVDVRVGGEGSVGVVGFGSGGQAVGFNGEAGVVEGGVAQRDDGIVWGGLEACV